MWSEGHRQPPPQTGANLDVRRFPFALRRNHPMPHEEVQHDGTDIGLELPSLHPPPHLVDAHELKRLDLIIPRHGRQASRQLHVVHVQHLAVEQARAGVAVRQREHAGGPRALAHQRLGQGCLLRGLGADAVRRGVGGLDAAGDGAVELARVRVQGAAAAGDPDPETCCACGIVAVLSRVAGHVGAAGGDAKERRGEALDLDDGAGGRWVAGGAEDAEWLAVGAVEDGEDVVVYGGVHEALEDGVDVRHRGVA